MFDSLSEFVTFSFGPSKWAILLTLIIALSLPALLHLWMYRTKAPTSLPSFLLVGPSGSGKTTLMTLVERGKAAKTHTTHGAGLRVECSLPVDAVAASNRYRSVNDPTNQVHKRFFLVDTPGHGKLRSHAVGHIARPQNLKGIIYVVDASTLASDAADNELTEAAQYLYDVLNILQKRYTSAKSSKGPSEMPVLVLANKSDLFTAMPVSLVKRALEDEISQLRDSKSKGLIDSGVGMDDDLQDDKEALGGGGEGKFEFSLMEEYNVPIEIASSSIESNGKEDVAQVWKWISEQL